MILLIEIRRNQKKVGNIPSNDLLLSKPTKKCGTLAAGQKIVFLSLTELYFLYVLVFLVRMYYHE